MSTSQHKPLNGSTASASISASASGSALRSAGNGSAGRGSTGALPADLPPEEADSAPDKSDDASAVPSDDGCQGVNGDSADNSQALDSIESPSHRERSLGGREVEEGAAGGSGSAANYARGQLKVESSDVYQIVDALRRNTNLSFDLSCEALRVVLTSLEQLYNGAINPYLEAVAVHVTGKVPTPKELLGITHDSKRLQYLFAQLADCKNDTEQRTWMLYEDEEDIIQFLEELVEILVSGVGVRVGEGFLFSSLTRRTTPMRTLAATRCPATSTRCSSTWCSTIRWRRAGPSSACCSRPSRPPATWTT